MPQNDIFIEGNEITSAEELEQLLESLHLSHKETIPCSDRDYADISDSFIRQLGELSNALNPNQYLEDRKKDATDDRYLIFHNRDAFLIIHFFEEGSALIGYCNTYYGHIYYLVNDRDALQHIANITQYDTQLAHSLLGKLMLCCDSSIMRNIILHFCRTGHEAQNCSWVEDFSYTGPDCWHRDWLKSMLLGHFAWEERRLELTRLRAMQATGEWQWGKPWPWSESHQTQVHWENPDEMDYLGQLANTKLPASTELPKQEKLLRKTARKLQKEESFTQRESGIRNLSFLKNCPNLRMLDLRCNDVEDLSPIASLQNLRDLNLEYNLISDLSPLAGLEQLRELLLRGNKISSLKPLQELHNLKNLNLRNNPLESGTLSHLRKCKRLEMLDLSYTGIQNLRELESCRAWSLTLYGNPNLTGLEVITTMKKLTDLTLDLEIAQQYDIPTLMPRFTEYARYGNHVLYVWPEKYFD